MKTSAFKIFIALVLAIGAIAAIWQGPANAPQLFTRMIPTGAVLVLESPDFGAMLRDWQTSKEKSVVACERQLQGLLAIRIAAAS